MSDDVRTPTVRRLGEAELRGDEVISTPYGPVELQHGYLTDDSSARVFDAMDFQRAAQAYIWSTPLVSMATWRREQDRCYDGGRLGTFAVLESLREKRGIVTGNLTTTYIFQFVSTDDGPVVIDVPPGPVAGAVLDAWQRPVIDLGLTGPDAGDGGRYVIVGPGNDAPDEQPTGVLVHLSPTVVTGVGLRILSPDPDVTSQVKQSLRMGRLGDEPAPCTFNEGIDVEWSATAPRGLEYWRVLHQVIDVEPVREQDKVWMAMLEPLGIRKGQPFDPDGRQQQVLIDGAAFGELMARNLQVVPRYTRPYWDGTSWYKSFDFTIPQSTDYKVELDERTTWFYEAVSSTKGMLNPTVGQGQVYMTTKRDANDQLLRADRTYRLSIPAGVPVAHFWSVTLYSEQTRRPYDNGGTDVRSVSIDSLTQDLMENPDGSIDLYIGASCPHGKDSNYLRTVDDDGWFVYFRLYGPTEPFFDKTWTLPDFERLDT
jgi:hypothetical protein